MEKSKFDINTIIGFLLIGGIFLYFGYFSQSDDVAAEETFTASDSTEVVEETQKLQQVDTVIAVPDSVKASMAVGPFLNQGADEQLFTLENEVLEVKISSKGGQVVSARLKNYQTYDSLPLYLIKENAKMNLLLEGEGSYNSSQLVFSSTKSNKGELMLSAKGANGQSLNYSYKLSPDSYMLDWQVSSNGLNQFVGDKPMLNWEMETFRHEKNLKTEKTTTELDYRLAEDGDVDDITGEGEEIETVEERVDWFAFKQQFFSTIVWNKSGDFTSSKFYLSGNEAEGYTKSMAAQVAVSKVGNNLNADLGIYLGPNKYDILEAYDKDFDQLIPLGWGILGWINRGIVINLFNWLEAYGLNYGLIILIIALVIKMIIFPLTYTSYRSMAKTRVLKPEMDEINEKYKDKDAMQKQQAVMELYQKAGVNPLGGCIPMLFQMPVLIALFRFFPASIELRQQPFLWAHDLSTYDSIWNLPFEIPFYGDHVSLFTLLMTVSTLIYTYMNQQMTGANQQMPQMKYMVYLMPIVFLGVFNNYAAGLSYYYFVANMITFGQQFAIRSFIDEDKIRAKIQEKKEKPKKENRLMRRMREMQEQQEQNTRAGRRANK